MKHSLEKMLVLLADDDSDDRYFFEEAFKEFHHDHTLIEFENAKNLLAYLNNPQNNMPHIIFLDLNMPEMSGIDCLKEIRANQNLRDLTVAIYSTSSRMADKEKTFLAGANIYITKPDDFNDLVKVINHVMKINWQYHSSGLNKDTFVLSM